MSGQERRKTRILLADGHYIVRQGIRRIFEAEPDMEVVGEADNGEQAVRLARELQPDIIVMEARMGKLDSVEATRRVKTEHPEAAVLVLSAHEDEEYTAALVAVGAAGSLLKSADGGELVQAIRSVRAGGFVCDRVLARKVFKRASHLPVTVNSAEHLTRRELEALKLAAKGMNNRAIATNLGLTEGTVKGYFVKIFGKLMVGSRTEAVMEAVRRGWVSTEDGQEQTGRRS